MAKEIEQAFHDQEKRKKADKKTQEDKKKDKRRSGGSGFANFLFGTGTSHHVAKAESSSKSVYTTGPKHSRKSSDDSGNSRSIRSYKSKHSRNGSDMSQRSGMQRVDSAIDHRVEYLKGSRVPPVAEEMAAAEEALDVESLKINDAEVRNKDMEEPPMEVEAVSETSEPGEDEGCVQGEEPAEVEEPEEANDLAGAGLVPPEAPMPPRDVSSFVSDHVPPLAPPEKKKEFSDGYSTTSISEMRKGRESPPSFDGHVHFDKEILDRDRNKKVKGSKKSRKGSTAGH